MNESEEIEDMINTCNSILNPHLDFIIVRYNGVDYSSVEYKENNDEWVKMEGERKIENYIYSISQRGFRLIKLVGDIEYYWKETWLPEYKIGEFKLKNS